MEEEHFARIIRAFSSHAEHTLKMLQKYRQDYEGLPEVHQRLLCNYINKLRLVEECTKKNQRFYDHVIAPHRSSHPPPMEFVRSGPTGMNIEMMQSIVLSQTESENLKSLLRQVMRDWSLEGAEEREKSYRIFYDELQKEFPTDRDQISILVPGAGLGRLAYEISQLGFRCQGNEFSLFMLLTAEMFLTRHLQPDSLEIHPFATPFSNVISLEDQLKSVKVPDIQVEGASADFSMVAGDFVEVYANDEECWNAIVTCYFIDTAKNIVEYISMIYDLLLPGGIWINNGPLLYHFEGHAKEPSIELSVEEIIDLCQRIGFIFEWEGFVDSTYAQNSRSLHQTIYKCWSFKARKPIK